MKRLLIMIFLSLNLVSIVESAQIQVRQTTFTRLNSLWYSESHVVMNTRTGESLVYWSKPPSKENLPAPSVGRLLNAKGIPISKEFELPGNEFGSVIGYLDQKVGYNPITNEFLVAYVGHDESSNVVIYVQRLSAKGVPLGAASLITKNPELNSQLYVWNVVFNPKNGGYTVLFSVGGSTIEGIVLTDKGIPLGPGKIVLVAPTSVIFPNYMPSGDKLLLVWRNIYHGNDEADFWLKTVDPMLNNIDPSNSGAKMNRDPVSADHYGFKTIDLGTLVPSNASFPSIGVGVVYYPDNANTKGRTINAQGKFSGSPFIAFVKPLANTKLHSPSAAFTLTQKGVRGVLIGLKGTSFEKSSLWAQVLDQNGKPIGTPVEVYEVPQDEAIVLGGPIYALLSNPTDTVFRFVWFGTVAKKDKFGVFESGRILKLTLDLTNL